MGSEMCIRDRILRGTVRKIADNEPYKMPATIDDPAILDEIKGT